MTLKDIDIKNAPGYIVFEAIGKTVIRPGGMKLTNIMLDSLNITSENVVVEFAPGAGNTTKLVMKAQPKDYIAVERNEKFAKNIKKILKNTSYSCIIGTAQNSNVSNESADVVFGEAMLTMQPWSNREAIIKETHRILKKDGLYAIHEVALKEENLSEDIRNQIYEDLQNALKVSARPLTEKEWTTMLNEQDFTIVKSHLVKMNIFSPKAFIRDEGFRRTRKILFNILGNKDVRIRVRKMRKTFSKHAEHLSAILLIAKKE